MRNLERAILSVSDKSGLVELARALTARGVELLSTGGTAKHLADAGIPVTPIAQWSGAPEILGGRVKTLTPRVFGAILHDRDVASHRDDVERLGIPPIDLVVVNLYPFEQTIARDGVTVDEAIEQIDVGGPSMLRAAAKNHKHVLPLCDPSLYPEFLREFESGAISDDFRRRCAVAVFEKTAKYDAAIAAFLDPPVILSRKACPERSRRDGEGSPNAKASHLEILRSAQDDGGIPLRYGENPQQSATFSGGAFEQLQGKELSYNNILDLDAAMRLAHAFREPAAAVIKHTNPCGVARRATYAEALRAAVEADPVSAYGGIVGANREFDEDAARVIESLFLEVIVAPSFSDGARAILAKKKNLRLIAAPPLQNAVEVRSAAGGILQQSVDRIGPRDAWRVVTAAQASEADLRGLEFAWIVCAHVKSNAIVLTGESQSIGVGAGQMSRVDAAKLAVMKANQPTQGAYAASDAFFPFRDGLDILADAGVRAIIQPGGSVRDAEVIAAADERGVAMVFTGERHFRH